MKRLPLATALTLLLFASPALAQVSSPGETPPRMDVQTPGGFGLGVNTAVGGTGNTFGVGLAFDIGVLRFDPGVAFARENVSVDGTRNDQGDFDAVSTSETVLRFGTGIHGVLMEAGRARVWVGGDFAYGFVDAAETVSSQDNGVRTEVIDDTVTTFFSVTPVLGGEFTLAGGLALGLRVGPEFIFGSPDVENEPNIDSASIFVVTGHARLDLIYYF